MEEKKVSDTIKKEFARLLLQRNTLYFRCDCGHRFTMLQPNGSWVRCDDNTNFFIPMNEEKGNPTPIRCPVCRKTNRVRRVAPPWSPHLERKKEIYPPKQEEEIRYEF